MRDRSTLRKMVEERAMRVATGEGWGEGYNGGLERGRKMAVEATRRENQHQRRLVHVSRNFLMYYLLPCNS
jgi:formyltetrahydrofolate synthetase